MKISIDYEGGRKEMEVHPQETVGSVATRAAKFFGIQYRPELGSPFTLANGRTLPGKITIQSVADGEKSPTFALVDCRRY